ncbi:hypothetical protein [Aestuariivivens insulae]|uniref:hypothetical protein n=1 Tax=Aestuariivivens insulae TaxID=1621988 RepID=UPI001F58D254|nr:hypothetical protein [Aestuariivivens insulae]
MKTIKLTWIALIIISLTFSCSNGPLENNTSSALKTSKTLKVSKTVTVPFKADFFTKRDYSFTPDCTEYASDGYTGNYQVGEGSGTHLGEFTVIISFCGAPNLQYKAGEGVFVADNGDELFFNIPPWGVIGHIYPIFDDPYYELWFGDDFEITGGTGRFEGAWGHGATDSWVNLSENGWMMTPDGPIPDGFIPEHQTDHMFTGELTFYPGKRSNK